MKERAEKEFNRITAEAVKRFGTAHLETELYQAPSTADVKDRWRIYVRLKVLCGDRVFDGRGGFVEMSDEKYTIHYGIWILDSVDQLFSMMDDDYKHILADYRLYEELETAKLLEAL